MPLLQNRHLPALTLFLLYLLMYWTAPHLYRPGMDAMTYGAVAKHILETGEWARLHYSAQAYADFFQHPPLGIWMMAISMKVLGTADWVLKVLPSLIGASVCTAIYYWGKKVAESRVVLAPNTSSPAIRPEMYGFIAALVLLTSTRFVKYSTELMLDPFLVGFSVFGLILLARSALVVSPYLGGLMIGAAFLSKGLFAFAPFVTGLVFISAKYFSKETRAGESFRKGSLWILGTATPFILWFIFGGANEYLYRYYVEHVAGRIGSYTLREHFEPLRNLFILYWPWIPFYFYGAYRILRANGLRALARWEGLALVTSMAFMGGFVLVASFLEQYNTSFYPFAAVVVAYPLSEGRIGEWLFRAREKILLGLLLVIIGVGIFSIIRPAQFTNSEFRNPIRIALKRAARECTPVVDQRIMISTTVSEIWYTLAMGAWNTPWDAYSGQATMTPAEARSDILLAAASDLVGAGWMPTSIRESGLVVYSRDGVGARVCGP